MMMYDDEGEESFRVLPARVWQRFMITTRLASGRSLGLMYQLPDSEMEQQQGRSKDSKKRHKALKKIPLDAYEIVCPI